MLHRVIVLTGILAIIIGGIWSCSDMGDSPPQPGSLTAIPSAVTVGQGGTAKVWISGGTVPYVVAESPSASLAVAAFVSTDTLMISGVTVASAAGSTSVKVKDSSPSPGKEASVPITKIP